MVSLFLAWLMAATAPSTDSLRVINAKVGIEPVLPADTCRYRIVYFWRGHRCVRIRTDIVLTTVVAGGDTLGKDLLVSGVQRLLEQTTAPPSGPITVIQQCRRVEQRRSGLVTSGPRWANTSSFNEDHLWALNHKWRGYPKPPLPSQLLPLALTASR